MNREFRLLPEAASSFAREVDALWWFEVAVATFFSLLILVLVVGFSVRYRRSRHRTPAQIHGSVGLELVWTLIPLALALGMFAWGARVHFRILRVPADGLDVWVTGKQWMWKHQHPDGQREINDLHVPVNTPIRLRMISEDVIHSWFVPAFRVKRDVVPGRYSSAWFEATEPGVYRLLCAEYCGTKHSLMGGNVYVLEQEDYQRWLARNAGNETSAQVGERLYTQFRCDTCHHGRADARGPELAGRFGTASVLADGTPVEFDHDYFRESILEPNALKVAGWEPNMPSYAGQITEEEILQIAAWLQSVPRAAADGAGEGSDGE